MHKSKHHEGCRPHGKPQHKVCSQMVTTNKAKPFFSDFIYKVDDNLNCNFTNVTYKVHCKVCTSEYMGRHKPNSVCFSNSRVHMLQAFLTCHSLSTSTCLITVLSTSAFGLTIQISAHTSACTAWILLHKQIQTILSWNYRKPGAADLPPFQIVNTQERNWANRGGCQRLPWISLRPTRRPCMFVN